MHLKKGEKLKMGPLWDFDLAFGNSLWGKDAMNPHAFYLNNVKWFSRLLTDPAFVTKVKERFNYFYGRQNDIYAYINDTAVYLKYAAQENENRWNTLYVNLNYPVSPKELNVWGSYYNEVQSMKSFLADRLEWLNVEINNLH